MPVWDKWIPGVLSREQLKTLCQNEFISGVPKDWSSLDHSAMDLHITDDAYLLGEGSVKPFGSRVYLDDIRSESLATKLDPDENGHFRLEPKRTYLFRLKEVLEGDGGGSIWGQATAKSSVGRLDVLVRLVVDGTDRYEGFSPRAIETGRASMFVEVTPITFPVIVKDGISLNQLRLFYGDPADCELRGSEVTRCCLSSTTANHHLRVDLRSVEIAPGMSGCGFRAKVPSKATDPIQLWETKPKPNPSQWWELIQSNSRQRLPITKSHFYILRSKERLSLPPGIAVYARAIDEEIGEMRIHYAGFAHPFFGWNRADDQRGTPLVFEVRGHDVDVNLRDDEILARLQFFRMSEDAQPEADEDNPYNKQTVMLSKYLGPWTGPNAVSE